MEAVELARAIEPWTWSEATSENRNVTSHLVLAMRHAIDTGVLRSGERLPPERALASALNVSRPTISAVMGQLRRGGLVASRQGSGTWVTVPDSEAPAPVPFADRLHQTGLIDLAAATAPDASVLPPFRIEQSDLLASEPANGLNPVGLPVLREAIASRLRRWAPSVRSDGIVVTSGAHQALALLVAALVPRGAVVLVEDITYGGLVDIIETNGCRVVGVERDEQGPTPDSLRAQLEHHRPAMVVIVASVHSPTGAIASDERSHDLAEILATADTRVVIDETYAELDFASSSRALASTLDARIGDRVILVGSLSKTAWLGLRTGWIAVSPADCRAVVRRRWSQFDLGPSVPSQLVAAAVFAGIDDLVASRTARLSERSEWLIGTIRRELPDWELSPVHGGLALWARVATHDSFDVVEQAASNGVALMPGSACRYDRGTDPHVRICFDRPINLMEEAIDRLRGASTTRRRAG